MLDDDRLQAFFVDEKVQKVGGDYQFQGYIRAAFPKHSGAYRYVVEDDRGILHIFSAKQLEIRD
jgi:hypothetical protein